MVRGISLLCLVLLAGISRAESFLKSDDFLYALSLGASVSEVEQRFDSSANAAPVVSDREANALLSAGVFKPFAETHELGMSLMFTQADSKDLFVFRFVDYRYAFWQGFRLKGFFGIAQYHDGLNAYGYYGGAGLEWQPTTLPLSVSLEAGIGKDIARDKLLADDPPTQPGSSFNDIFYDVESLNAYLTWYF